MQRPGARFNVLIVLADDIGAEMFQPEMGGSDFAHTPTIDALARRGVLFPRTWAFPVCSSTRAAIHTGRYGFRTGIGNVIANRPDAYGLPASEITLPELVNAELPLYRTALIGKWHLDRSIVGPNVAGGWNHYAGELDNFLGGHHYFNWDKVVDGVLTNTRDYATTDNVDDAIAWVLGSSRPWFLHLAFNAAHSPLHRPPRHLHTTPIPDLGFADEIARAMFKAMIEAMDTELGRLFRSVPARVWDETVVIFTTDNGTPGDLLEPRFDRERGKGTLHELGIRVPMIIAGPPELLARPGAVASNALTSVADLFATVAELAGVDPERTFPGVTWDSVSLLPYLQEPQRPSLRRAVFSEHFRGNGPIDTFPVVTSRGSVHCQEDVGLGTQDTPLELQICGLPLAYRNSVDLSLTGAPPLANGLLFEAEALQPTPWNGATLISPTPTQRSVRTNASGRIVIPRFLVHADPHESGLTRRYVQIAVEDARVQPGGYLVSNAVEVRYLRYNRKAIRGERYKLITNILNHRDGRGEELYDLVADPQEEVNLLASGLAALHDEAREAYQQLWRELDDLRASR